MNGHYKPMNVLSFEIELWCPGNDTALQYSFFHQPCHLITIDFKHNVMSLLSGTT